MTDSEAKFLIGNPQAISAILEATEQPAGPVDAARQVATVDSYLDTEDWRLYRNGWLCRWRDESGQYRLCIEPREPADGSPKKAIIEEAVTSLPESFKNWLRDNPSSPAAKRLKAIVKGKQVRQLFQVRKRRQHLVRQQETGAVALEIDETTITAPKTKSKLAPGELRFEELHLKLNDGQPEAIREMAAALQSKFDLLPARLSDFERGAQAAGLELPEPDAEFEKLRARDPVIKLAYQYLAQQFAQVLFHEPRAWEALDPEGVHQMRVATRRIRAILRAFKSMFPEGTVERVNREFRWLARLLGEVRDLDVYLMKFDQYADEMTDSVADSLKPYRDHLKARWSAAQKELLDGLSSEQYRCLVSHFREFLDDGLSREKWEGSASDSIQQAAVKMIDRRLKKVLKSGRAVTKNSPAEELHAVRIQGKRLRYLLEFFHPFYSKCLKQTIRATKAIQDVLGDHQDACVASQRLQTYADSLSKTEDNRQVLDALDRLIDSQDAHARQERESFPDVWAAFDQPKLRKQIRDLLVPAK